MVAKLKVFLSRPTSLSPQDLESCANFEGVLEALGFDAVTIGVSSFGNKAPLLQVRDAMSDCHGAVVLGFVQLTVMRGVSKPGTPKEQAIRGIDLPSPWNQLEAGIAYGMGLPILLAKGDISPQGIFDPSAGDSFIHEIPAAGGWVGSRQLMASTHEWANLVRLHASDPLG